MEMPGVGGRVRKEPREDTLMEMFQHLQREYEEARKEGKDIITMQILASEYKDMKDALNTITSDWEVIGGTGASVILRARMTTEEFECLKSSPIWDDWYLV